MKLPENLFNKEELEAIENAKIKIDFSKNYTEDEISKLEIQLKDACLDYGFTEGKPNSNCKM